MKDADFSANTCPFFCFCLQPASNQSNCKVFGVAPYTSLFPVSPSNYLQPSSTTCQTVAEYTVFPSNQCISISILYSNQGIIDQPAAYLAVTIRNQWGTYITPLQLVVARWSHIGFWDFASWTFDDFDDRTLIGNKAHFVTVREENHLVRQKLRAG